MCVYMCDLDREYVRLSDLCVGLGWVFYASCKVNKEEVVDTNGERTSFSFSWCDVVRDAEARRSAYVVARFVSPLTRFLTDFIASEGRLKSW